MMGNTYEVKSSIPDNPGSKNKKESIANRLEPEHRIVKSSEMSGLELVGSLYKDKKLRDVATIVKIGQISNSNNTHEKKRALKDEKNENRMSKKYIRKSDIIKYAKLPDRCEILAKLNADRREKLSTAARSLSEIDNKSEENSNTVDSTAKMLLYNPSTVYNFTEQTNPKEIGRIVTMASKVESLAGKDYVKNQSPLNRSSNRLILNCSNFDNEVDSKHNCRKVTVDQCHIGNESSLLSQNNSRAQLDFGFFSGIPGQMYHNNYQHHSQFIKKHPIHLQSFEKAPKEIGKIVTMASKVESLAGKDYVKNQSPLNRSSNRLMLNCSNFDNEVDSKHNPQRNSSLQQSWVSWEEMQRTRHFTMPSEYTGYDGSPPSCSRQANFLQQQQHIPPLLQSSKSREEISVKVGKSAQKTFKNDENAELGSRLEQIDIEALEQPKKSKKHVANRGELVLSNVFNGLRQIKKELGSHGTDTMFSNTARFFKFLTGVDERHLKTTKKSEDLNKTKKSRKRECILAAEKMSSENQIKLSLYLEHCWKEEIQITLDKIQEYLRLECKFDVSRTLLNDMMHGLGYTYRKKSGTPLIEERSDLIVLRERYLTLKEKYEKAGIQPFFGYFDETWIFEGMTSEYAWQRTHESAYKIARMANLEEKRSGPPKGKNKGKRAIVLAVLTSDGILPGSSKVIIPGHDQELMDYHTMMTARSYEQYMEEIIPVFVDEARKQGKVPIMIIDNSPLHNSQIDKLPQLNSTKPVLRDIIAKYGVQVDEKWNLTRLKMEFKKIIDANGGRDAMKKFKIDEWARDNYGCIFLRLPPYHCCFNPIELVWAQLKDWLKQEGKTSDRLQQVKRRAEIWLASFTGEDARNVIRKTGDFEQSIREKIKEKKRVDDVNDSGDSVSEVMSIGSTDASLCSNYSDYIFSSSECSSEAGS